MTTSKRITKAERKANRAYWENWLKILPYTVSGPLRDEAGWREAYKEHLKGSIPPPDIGWLLDLDPNIRRFRHFGIHR